MTVSRPTPPRQPRGERWKQTRAYARLTKALDIANTLADDEGQRCEYVVDDHTTPFTIHRIDHGHGPVLLAWWDGRTGIELTDDGSLDETFLYALDQQGVT